MFDMQLLCFFKLGLYIKFNKASKLIITEKIEDTLRKKLVKRHQIDKKLHEFFLSPDATVRKKR